MVRGVGHHWLWCVVLSVSCGGGQQSMTPTRSIAAFPDPPRVPILCGGVIGPPLGPVVMPNVVWRAQTGGPIVASATEVANNIVVGSLDGALYRFTLDGTLVFRVDTGAPIRSRALSFGGANGHALVANEAGDVMRIDATGRVVWRVQLNTTIAADPMRANSKLVYVAADGIHAIDSNGNVHWHHVEATTIDSTPVVTRERHVVFGTVDGRVVALDETGTLRWTTRVNAAVSAPLSLARDGTIVVNTALGQQHTLSTEGVLLRSEERASPPLAAEDREGNRYFAGADQSITGARGDGTILWSYSLGANVAGSVLLTSSGALVAGADDGILYALD